MKTTTVIASLIPLLTISAPVFAADPASPTESRQQIQQEMQIQDQTRDRERIYGSEMMTPQERAEHAARMRSMKTEQEREAYRMEHKKKMDQRMHERSMQHQQNLNPERGGRGAGRGR